MAGSLIAETIELTILAIDVTRTFVTINAVACAVTSVNTNTRQSRRRHEVERDFFESVSVMRYVVVCDIGDEPAAIAEAWRRFDRSSDRIVVLSPRIGESFETKGILSVPMKFALEDARLRNWRRIHWVRKAIACAAGVRSTRFSGSIQDLLLNIEACDPDVIHLGKVSLDDGWSRNARKDSLVEELSLIPAAIVATRTLQDGAATIRQLWSRSFSLCITERNI